MRLNHPLEYYKHVYPLVHGSHFVSSLNPLLHQVTSRLSAVDSLPMSRGLGFGAKYLQDHFSSWAKQQGGYVRTYRDISPVVLEVHLLDPINDLQLTISLVFCEMLVNTVFIYLSTGGSFCE